MRRLVGIACACIGSAGLVAAAALPASASGTSPHSQQAVIVHHVAEITVSHSPRARHAPLYEQSLSSEIQCAHWAGTLSWGGNGSIAVPAYIQLEGTIYDTCNNGWARLYLHWDTIDNPKEKNPGYAGPNGHNNTPYYTEDTVNTYKDIWVLLCSSDHEGYRCGNKKGPGA